MSAFSHVFPMTNPTDKEGWYWVDTENIFDGWVCTGGHKELVESNLVYAVKLDSMGKPTPGAINCMSCAVKNGHGIAPNIEDLHITIAKALDGSDFSEWIQACPIDTKCSNSQCQVAILMGSPCVKHKGFDSYGCPKCAVKHWVSAPMPVEWNWTVEGPIMVPTPAVRKIISLGMKFGPLDPTQYPKTYVVDVRKKVRNPWKDKDLRKLVGYDPKILEFVSRCSGAQKILDYWTTIFKSSYYSYKNVAFACHGGKHRSVAMAELLAERLKSANIKVEVIHRDVQRSK